MSIYMIIARVYLSIVNKTLVPVSISVSYSPTWLVVLHKACNNQLCDGLGRQRLDDLLDK